MDILISTQNEGKKKEMLEVLKNLSHIRWLSLNNFPTTEEVDENGKTFEENALLKAKHFAQKFNIPTIGEDSGLIVDAFPEKFGIRTRREISTNDDVEWLRIFLEMMEGQKNRNATFYSSMAYFDPKKNRKHTVLGTCSGQITEFPQTPLEKGIPISAVFIPDGHDIVYSAMKKKEKNAVSHRGWSTQAMVQFLESLIE
jgi:XTP/dITP diphosphohydrolase